MSGKVCNDAAGKQSGKVCGDALDKQSGKVGGDAVNEKLGQVCGDAVDTKSGNMFGDAVDKKPCVFNAANKKSGKVLRRRCGQALRQTFAMLWTESQAKFAAIAENKK